MCSHISGREDADEKREGEREQSHRLRYCRRLSTIDLGPYLASLINTHKKDKRSLILTSLLVVQPQHYPNPDSTLLWMPDLISSSSSPSSSLFLQDPRTIAFFSAFSLRLNSIFQQLLSRLLLHLFPSSCFGPMGWVKLSSLFSSSFLFLLLLLP